ncbi:replication protein P [Pseudomonas sp.]|uniref:replication protein P n=1 Tax=Pseudomonas sp. TaxID=306 RepID=UPI00257BE7D6|nr:replication protein P [Pseudomonas sp.]
MKPVQGMRPALAITTNIVSAGAAGCPDVPQRKPSAESAVAALSPQARLAVEGLINRLFREIRNARPAWRQAWATNEALASAKVTWLLAFIEAGINDWDRQIEYGLKGLRADPSDFVPSPGKFIGWCRPTAESLGLKSPERAYQEACRNAHPSARASAVWSHPVTYHAAIDVGLDVLMQLSGVETWKLFDRSYSVMVQRAVEGQELGEAVALGLGHDSQKTEAERAEEYSLQHALLVREAQGISLSGQPAREALLSRLGIRRMEGVNA